ncbi:hypothetical protein A9F13_05g03036 [Clavispora lusitaniae]|uniref:Uncharacterized protein n=1 Tax=Clavispora lusitaniae TaxID=36911 RepID=A0AA91Q177_CLALS|nr:hypothetical protein A9F13_05g03036 [Clavispora lusitaniae]
MLNRAKLSGSLNTSGPVFDSANFTPIMSQILAPVFDGPLRLEDDDIPVENITQSSSQSLIVSERHRSIRHFTDYQAKVLSTFASAFSPYSVLPRANSAFKSFVWYQRLLLNSPIIFFLKQRQTLLSESSVLFRNHALESLKSSISAISAPYNTSVQRDQRIRNYHLTDLVSTDIFKLATLAESKRRVPLEELSSGSFWKNFPSDNRLSQELLNAQKPVLVDTNNIAQSPAVLNDIPNRFPMRKILRDIESIESINQIKGVFPFDMVYNDIYILTIEHPILQENHSPVIELLEKSKDFEVIAVRVSSQISDMRDSVIGEESSIEEPTAKFDATYEELLQWAEEKHNQDNQRVSGIIPVLQKLGQWGFVKVEEGALGFTLFK